MGWFRYGTSRRTGGPVGNVPLVDRVELDPFPMAEMGHKWLHPWNLTWNLKGSPWKRWFLLETIIFRFHVKFRGSTNHLQILVWSSKLDNKPGWTGENFPLKTYHAGLWNKGKIFESLFRMIDTVSRVLKSTSNQWLLQHWQAEVIVGWISASCQHDFFPKTGHVLFHPKLFPMLWSEI